MVKKGIVKTLFDRAKFICSNEEFGKEKLLITNVLKQNGNPKTFIDKYFKDIVQTILSGNEMMIILLSGKI